MVSESPAWPSLRESETTNENIKPIFAVVALAAGAYAAERPNILFIFSDDHSFYDVGAYGNKEVRTPNIFLCVPDALWENFSATKEPCAGFARGGECRNDQRILV